MAKKRIYTYNTWQMETDEELEENLDAILREMDSRGILGVRFVGQDAGIVQNVVIEYAQAIVEAATGRCAPDDGDPCCGGVESDTGELDEDGEWRAPAQKADDIWDDITDEDVAMIEDMAIKVSPVVISVGEYEITVRVR